MVLALNCQILQTFYKHGLIYETNHKNERKCLRLWKKDYEAKNITKISGKQRIKLEDRCGRLLVLLVSSSLSCRSSGRCFSIFVGQSQLHKICQNAYERRCSCLLWSKVHSCRRAWCRAWWYSFLWSSNIRWKINFSKWSVLSLFFRKL
jgi:hypothetical protein